VGKIVKSEKLLLAAGGVDGVMNLMHEQTRLSKAKLGYYILLGSRKAEEQKVRRM
jgi:hypothetical protein